MSENHSANLDGVEHQFDHWRAGAKLAATRWVFRAFPPLAATVLKIAASGFEPASIPHFFSTGVGELEPALNDDLLELYGRAGQVLLNRFAFFNSPQAFDHGINWEPGHSPGWRAELHAGDYLFDLAVTFRISGEEIYARQLRYLVADWIASNPPAGGTGWQLHILARRVRNWMLAGDLARRDWERDREFHNLVGRSLAMQVTFLLGQLRSLASPAARLDASRALLCASRFFNGSSGRQAWHAGFDLLADALAAPHPEPWPHACLARAQTLMEWILWSARGAGAGFLRQELELALADLENLLLTNGTLPLLGPEARLAQDELADLAALAAATIKSPAWKSIAGKFGILPNLHLGETGKRLFDGLNEIEWRAPNHASSGAEILRVAGPQNSVLTVAAHLPASPGEHQDFTSYELMLNNQRVVVDSGSFAPDESKYFPSPRAHNILLVDGHEPHWENPESSSSADFREFSPGHARLQLTDPGFRFLGLQHERAWFRLDADAWLILDWLDGPGVHACSSLLHFYPTFELVAEIDRTLAQSRAQAFSVIPVGDAKPLATTTRGEHPEFPGWYSPDFGVRFPAGVLSVHWNGVELPWLGGVLITRGIEEPLRQVEVVAAERRMRLGFSGKTYKVEMR